MQTYEYRCPEGHEFERFYRKISDAATSLPCPECGRPAERQLSGGAGLLFKGSGFYLTDYGRNAHRKTGGEKPTGEKAGGEKPAGDSASSSSKSGESTGAASKSESKPASGGSEKSSGTKKSDA